MNDLYIKRLCLGTVQLGQDYGIANKKGKPSKGEAFNILNCAYDAGIDTLESADSYGDSEEIIGEFIARSGKSFNIISKIPHNVAGDAEDIERYCKDTLKKLGQSRIYAYLVHGFGDITAYGNGLWDRIRSLKEKALINKIGVSIYKVEELEYLLSREIPFDIIQIPYNIFDQRFKEHFLGLKERSIEIYVRSVFLQGLFLMDIKEIDIRFQPIVGLIKRLHDLSGSHGIPVHALCLAFALLNPSIDKVIIGVDTPVQLKENIDCLSYIDKVGNIYGILESLKFHDEELVLPINWK